MCHIELNDDQPDNRRTERPAFGRSYRSPRYLPASASHFFMNEVLAAPASGFPFFPTALPSQTTAALPLSPLSHFFMKDVLAAPDSGLPFLSTACAAHPGVAADAADMEAAAAAGADVWAQAMPTEKQAATATGESSA